MIQKEKYKVLKNGKFYSEEKLILKNIAQRFIIYENIQIETLLSWKTRPQTRKSHAILSEIKKDKNGNYKNFSVKNIIFFTYPNVVISDSLKF